MKPKKRGRSPKFLLSKIKIKINTTHATPTKFRTRKRREAKLTRGACVPRSRAFPDQFCSPSLAWHGSQARSAMRAGKGLACLNLELLKVLDCLHLSNRRFHFRLCLRSECKAAASPEPLPPVHSGKPHFIHAESGASFSSLVMARLFGPGSFPRLADLSKNVTAQRYRHRLHLSERVALSSRDFSINLWLSKDGADGAMPGCGGCEIPRRVLFASACT